MIYSSGACMLAGDLTLLLRLEIIPWNPFFDLIDFCIAKVHLLFPKMFSQWPSTALNFDKVNCNKIHIIKFRM